MPSPSRRHARRPGRIDGLKVRVIGGPMLTDRELGVAMRALARLFVRAHEHAGDHEAIIPVPEPPSTLTVVAHRSPDHSDEAA